MVDVGMHEDREPNLRDMFAAQALGGMGTWCPGQSANLSLPEGLAARASWAYAQADAMMVERKRNAGR